MKKGMELPINMIIVITVAVLVIVVVAFFFTSQTSSGITDTEARRIFSQGCLNFDCSTTSSICRSMFDVISGQNQFWQDVGKACSRLYGLSDTNIIQCMKRCQSCSIPDGEEARIESLILSNPLNPDAACG